MLGSFLSVHLLVEERRNTAPPVGLVRSSEDVSIDLHLSRDTYMYALVLSRGRYAGTWKKYIARKTAATPPKLSMYVQYSLTTLMAPRQRPPPPEQRPRDIPSPKMMVSTPIPFWISIHMYRLYGGGDPSKCFGVRQGKSQSIPPKRKKKHTTINPSINQS
jgi:hypothetical protein